MIFFSTRRIHMGFAVELHNTFSIKIMVFVVVTRNGKGVRSPASAFPNVRNACC